MKILKIFVFAILTFGLLANCAAAQQTKRKKKVKKIETTRVETEMRQKIGETKSSEIAATDGAAALKTLAEGSDASVATPFVFVARTAETLAQMQKLVKNLPTEKIDFNRTAVVAVFAGMRNTGGFSLDVERRGDTISVKVAAPPKDAMVTQSLTTPYKIALVEVEQENSLNLDLSADFSSAAKHYRVTSGEFEFSGGFAGIHKTLAAEGAIDVLSFGEYVTMIFDLTGKTGESGRKLFEAASGVSKVGKINLARVEAGDFIDRPHPFLTATGQISADKLSLTFAPGKRNYVVNDGYAGGGKLEAAVSSQ